MEAMAEHGQSPGHTQPRVCSANLLLTRPSEALEEAHLRAFRHSSLGASVCCSVQWAVGPEPSSGTHSLGRCKVAGDDPPQHGGRLLGDSASGLLACIQSTAGEAGCSQDQIPLVPTCTLGR